VKNFNPERQKMV